MSDQIEKPKHRYIRGLPEVVMPQLVEAFNNGAQIAVPLTEVPFWNDSGTDYVPGLVVVVNDTQSLEYRLDVARRMMLSNFEKVQEIANRKTPGGDPEAAAALEDCEYWERIVRNLGYVLREPK